MKETKLSTEQLNVIAGNNGLRRYLSGLLLGKGATPRSSLYNLKGKAPLLSTQQVLSKWCDELQRLKYGSKYDRRILQFDLKQVEKWGPQGAVPPINDLMEEIVLPSFTEVVSDFEIFESEQWKQAKRDVVRELHRARCVGFAPLRPENVINSMHDNRTLESNSGWPDFTRRSKSEVKANALCSVKNGLWKTYPAIALFRNYNQKTRLVWMFPMATNIVEGSYFLPLQKTLMQSSDPLVRKFLAPWQGFEDVRKVLTEVYWGNSEYCAASDFSSTDSHFRLKTTMEVFDVIKECFQPRYREGLKESLMHMHTIPLIIGPDAQLLGEHGVSSGSNWTNFVETIFDWILAWYVARDTSSAYGGLYAIGDDMTWSSPVYQSNFPEYLAELGKKVGQDIRSDKTTNEKNYVVTLQRLVQRSFVRSTGEIKAVYSTIRALKSLIYPERFHRKENGWNKDMEAVRDFMILENCVDHPLFRRFCEFVAKGDPNLKVVASFSSSQLENLQQESKLIPGLVSTYNQEKRDQSDRKSVV